ncbi:MAG: S24 family peptidase [Parasulfuritortus sp.]|jgi:SOS-response transcriptional repressor LexA|nr:S24 family peptidase [Parasulfuritortus sp.]
MTSEKKPFPIPVRIAPDAPQSEEDLAVSACATGEPYALMVLGDSMLPEFTEGEVIVVEPEGIARDGAFVVAWANDEYIFRQLVKHPEGWMLKPLNPIYPNIPIDDVKETVKGVVVLKKKPGRRREAKRYD